MTDHNTRQLIPTIIRPTDAALDTTFRDGVEKALRDQNMRTWLEFEALKEGTDNQRERHAAGVLPEEELTHLARAILFKGFGEFKRWAKRDRIQLARRLKHTRDDCLTDCWSSMDGWPGHAEYEASDVAELAADEWETVKRIQAMAVAARVHPWLERSGGTVSVATTTHWATCRGCKAEVCRSSTKVTIAWAGRQLVREYAL